MLAVMVKVKGEPAPDVAVPLSTPVVALSVANDGNVPDVTVNVAAGEPVATTVNVPAVPATNVVLLALVIVGAVVGEARRIV